MFPACSGTGSGSSGARSSDKPIIPGYLIKPDGVHVVKDSNAQTTYLVTAVPGSFIDNQGTPSAVRVAAYAISSDTMARIRTSTQPAETVSGNFVGELRSDADGSLSAATLSFNDTSGYILLYVFDKVGGNAPIPTQITVPNPSAIIAAITEDGIGVFEGLFLHASQSLWTSTSELAKLPETGRGFTLLKEAADSDPGDPIVNGGGGNQTDSKVLAAAIVYARDKSDVHRLKVVAAIDKLVSLGVPADGSMTDVSSNIVGYVMAADLVGYRTPAFENYLKTLSTTWKGTMGDGTLYTMPEAWHITGTWMGGLQALLALATMDGYRGDKAALSTLADEWKALVSGKVADTTGMRWNHAGWSRDPHVPQLINSVGPVRSYNGFVVNIDGLIPGSLGSEALFQPAPVANPTAYRNVELLISFARVMERQGFPLTDHEDRAILRAFRALQARYQTPISGLGRGVWMTRYLDRKYGTTFSCGLEKSNSDLLWGAGAGSSLGWAWVDGPIQRSCPP